MVKKNDIERHIYDAIKVHIDQLKKHRSRPASERNFHGYIDAFQNGIKNYLSNNANGTWGVERQKSNRPENDSIDIYGQCNDTNWIIEIDTTRADQVAKKILSRVALWGLENPINYVAILYPNTQRGKNECEKYLYYGYKLLKKINTKSKILGLFVDSEMNTIEILDYSKHSHFLVQKEECSSMKIAAATAVNLYLDEKKPSDFDTLKKVFSSFVNDEEGPMRYNEIENTACDGKKVYTYTQFRQYGEGENWTKFVTLCKKNGIVIKECRRIIDISI